jgi:hypothetical protein
MQDENVYTSEPYSNNYAKNSWKTYGASIANWGIGILIIGLTFQICYYSCFQLPIKYFINLSEIALLVSNELFIIGGLILASIIYALNADVIRKKKRKISKIENLIFNQTFISVFNSIVVISLGIYLLFPLPRYKVVQVYGALFLFIPMILNSFFTSLTDQLNVFQLKMLFLSVLIIGLTIMSSGWYAERIFKRKYNGTYIQLKNNKEYKTDGSLLFIGKTEAFIFLHNKKDNSNIIIPVENIELFILKTK